MEYRHNKNRIDPEFLEYTKYSLLDHCSKFDEC